MGLVALSLYLWRFGQDVTLPPESSAAGQVRQAMSRRPDDPWPRGSGRVLLALPGTAEAEKAYLEPGGSFSPAAGSFGVSIWVLDEEGELVETSDSIPLRDIEQRLRQSDAPIPALVAETPFYRAAWSLVSSGHWRMVLEPRGGEPRRLLVALRSVGPAGGPIDSLTLQDGKLWINDRWRLEAAPALDVAHLGQEGVDGWTRPLQSGKGTRIENGWGHARFEVDPDSGLTLDLHDTRPAPRSDPFTSLSRVGSGLRLSLPDRRFADSIEAQVAHLMMGLVGSETRPGDPVSYPLAWQRDGAYVVVALVGAGRPDVARELIGMFAEVDFFGGFGSEADAPGLALWAIRTVASALRDPELEAALWPHVVRKVDLILELSSATGPVRKPVSGRVSPSYEADEDIDLVAKAAKRGLIMGRMDWQFPVLYVNAVSYRGLMDAAWLADRRREHDLAARWRATAEKLRQAWNAALRPSRRTNPRTLVSGIWPAFVVADDARFETALDKAWRRERTGDGGFREWPLWTYFELAKAQQWLYLGRPERSWLTLEWFWAESPAPGLYTLWEGEGGDPFGGWTQIRGPAELPPISPHYWAAAEMLSLQLAMLSYFDPRPETASLVIGSGVPRSWLGQPLSVAGIHTPAGEVDWEWTGKAVLVHVHGDPVKVALGPQFPPDTPLRLSFSTPAAPHSR